MKFLPSKKLIAGMALAVTMVLTFAPMAHADGRHDGHRDGYHDWHNHRRWYHGAWVTDAPVYAPPPQVVYAPPPPPSPGISLVLPIRIR